MIFISLKKSSEFIEKKFRWIKYEKISLRDFYKKGRSFVEQSNITSMDLSSLHPFLNNKRDDTLKIIFPLSFQNLCVGMQVQKISKEPLVRVSRRCLHS